MLVASQTIAGVWQESYTSVIGAAGAEQTEGTVALLQYRMAQRSADTLSSWFTFEPNAVAKARVITPGVSCKRMRMEVVREGSFVFLPLPSSICCGLKGLLTNCKLSGIVLPGCPALLSLGTVLVTGSLTVTISILKKRGHFPSCSGILLHTLICRAAPVSPPPPTSGPSSFST